MGSARCSTSTTLCSAGTGSNNDWDTQVVGTTPSSSLTWYTSTPVS